MGTDAQRTPPRPPPGYRWIAVRPGAAPPPRSGRQTLGPTPQYTTVPRWGLVEHFDSEPEDPAPVDSPSPAVLRAVLIPTMVLLGAAAVGHLVRYVLLLINRDTLLHPWVAAVATWLPLILSLAGIFALVASAVVLTNWLVVRRAAAYRHRGGADPRPGWGLWAGCLVPLVQLVFAPVFVVELAKVEDRLSGVRKSIVGWAVVWVASYVVSVVSFVTSFARDAQGIANNTVTTTIAYLVALAALVLVMRVSFGFDSSPVERPSKRWVIVPDGPTAGATQKSDSGSASGVVVESQRQNPAA